MTLGAVIATRELTIHGPKGARRVVLRIGKPRRQGTGAWACPFRIAGLGRQGVDRAYGEDAVQALQLALEVIRIQLDTSERSVTWLGLPVAVAFPRQILSGDVTLAVRLTRLVDREVIRWTRERSRRQARRRSPH
ncbi:MAG: DUF6968 family protein [Tepidiformaceae bacterium]